jgi:hypothetical protein
VTYIANTPSTERSPLAESSGSLRRAAGWGLIGEWTGEKEGFSIILAEAEPPRFAP